ncbi:hypothetical protein [Bradyrhizobium sp. SZCCHNPS1003]|uniref:hypothetical protein n=1 Tax=Bradyrhizobium sp. SZCCHNPS1003 TaxID=3057330 RepID=UPI0028EFE86E|nr:hypothetical protein [Bradyrhizobium sp. SZCCHNPS1003]
MLRIVILARRLIILVCLPLAGFEPDGQQLALARDPAAQLAQAGRFPVPCPVVADPVADGRSCACAGLRGDAA